MKTQGGSPQRTPKIVVRSLSAGATRGVVSYGNLRFPCTLGRTGRRAGKREGDGATPSAISHCGQHITGRTACGGRRRG
jgi:L,D-peptidoglycan transpeptidase YkuD (ErfK/YbiS/YcfS/YnhG family)